MNAPTEIATSYVWAAPNTNEGKAQLLEHLVSIPDVYLGGAQEDIHMRLFPTLTVRGDKLVLRMRIYSKQG